MKAGDKVKILKTDCPYTDCSNHSGTCNGEIGVIKDTYYTDSAYERAKEVPVDFGRHSWCIFKMHEVSLVLRKELI